ncbi:asparagine synthase (glutamine-hydrolyzing) [Fluviicola sp.]|uniref:asparagine synthase (glutamine-hydrolyzing) n=1 Tax=Fluviicola sp. TaxID=1917219 RepID=UPI0031DFB910
MCGISGIVNRKGKIESESEIRRMNQLIEHRGPDGDGIYCYNNVALGHRRLAILDLSELGKQPMHWGEKYTIVFNGEVYNYIEIREVLLAAGYAFQSESDTEVILAAYDKWGKDCVSRFNGMWSFVILDKEKNTLFCSRDRFGIKPFYYTISEESFRFGSEIKQLISERPVINLPVALDFIISAMEEATDETFFKGVVKLTPGHNLVYDLEKNTYQIEAFYSLPDEAPATKNPDSIGSYISLLEESVKLRMRSDVRVGTCLSGGLDSSTVAALASKNYNYQEQFYAIHAKSEEAATDESTYAGMVSDHLKLNLKTVVPGYPDFESNMNDVIYTQEEPFGSPSVFMQYFVFKEARKNNCIVMLDGQGGDETLLGYERYYPALIRSLGVFQRPKALLNSKKNSRLSMLEAVKYMLYFGNYKSRLNRVKRRAGFIRPAYLENYQSEALRKVSESYSDVRKMQKMELTRSQLPHLLRYEDKNSMKHSVEARLPFIDYRVVEFALNMENEAKIHDGWTKYVLRKGMSGLLPKEIVWRKNKLGFNAPENLWLEKHAAEMEKVIRESAIFNAIADVEKLDLNQLDKRMRWRIYNLAKWEYVFNVQLASKTETNE